MHVWLSATMKAKLMIQMLEQKKEVYSGAVIWENGELPFQRSCPLPVQTPSSYKEKEGRALFSIQLSFLLLAHSGPIHSSF